MMKDGKARLFEAFIMGNQKHIAAIFEAGYIYMYIYIYIYEEFLSKMR